jgi:hypothetical protein
MIACARHAVGYMNDLNASDDELQPNGEERNRSGVGGSETQRTRRSCADLDQGRRGHSHWVTDLAIEKTIEEALKITRSDVAENLEGLPPVKMHCSNLAADALHAAIEDYLKKEGRGEWLNGTKRATKKKSGAKKGGRRRRTA